MPEEHEEPEYLWIANNSETDPIEMAYSGDLNSGNFYSKTAKSKFRPLDTTHGNYITEIEDHWPNTNDVLAVNPEVLAPYLEEGQAAKVPEELEAWVRSEEGGFSTTLRFDPEFYEEPMEHDVILGSAPVSGPQSGETQREYRDRLQGETVRVTPVKGNSEAVFQQVASLEDARELLDRKAT